MDAVRNQSNRIGKKTKAYFRGHERKIERGAYGKGRAEILRLGCPRLMPVGVARVVVLHYFSYHERHDAGSQNLWTQARRAPAPWHCFWELT